MRENKMLTAQHSTAQHRRRLLNTQEESKWLYEAYLTDNDNWYGKRCPAIVFDVKQGEQYYIEWSNCRTVSKYIYDMRKCGGKYVLYNPNVAWDETVPDASGGIEIIIPADGMLYVGVGSNANVALGDISAACFDGDYIRIRKEA